MSRYLTLLRLKDIASIKPNIIIQKGRKYIRRGGRLPRGAVLQHGRNGGVYYETDRNRHFSVPKTYQDIKPYIETRMKNHPKLRDAIFDAHEDASEYGPKIAAREAIKRAKGKPALPSKGPAKRDELKQQQKAKIIRENAEREYYEQNQSTIDSHRKNAIKSITIDTIPGSDFLSDDIKEIYRNTRNIRSADHLISDNKEAFIKIRNFFVNMPKEQFNTYRTLLRNTFEENENKFKTLKLDELNPEYHNIIIQNAIISAVRSMVDVGYNWRDDMDD